MLATLAPAASTIEATWSRITAPARAPELAASAETAASVDG